MNLSDYFTRLLPYAAPAAKQLDLPVSVIMAQLAIESDYGRSPLATNTGNQGGIKYNKYSIAKGSYGKLGYADYKGDLGMFFQDYTRVMKLNYYTKVRDAVSVEDTVKALASSPYAESGYSGGQSILNVIKQFGLTKYDTQDIIENGQVIKNFSVMVPENASSIVIAAAIIGVGLLMLNGKG